MRFATPHSKQRPWLAGIWWALALLTLTLTLALFWTSLLTRETQGVAHAQEILTRMDRLSAEVRSYRYWRLEDRFDSLHSHETLLPQDRARIDCLKQLLVLLQRTTKEQAPEAAHFAIRDEYFILANRFRGELMRQVIQ